MSFLVEQFLVLKRPATRKSYSAAWRQWCEFRRSKGIKATPGEALKFLHHLRFGGASDNTLNNRYAALCSIYGFLVDMGALPKNPFSAIKRVFSTRQRRQVRPTKLIATEEVLAALEAPPANTRWGVAERALLAILFGSGLRRSEARGLRVGDIIVGEGPLYGLELEHTKAGKRQQRRLPAWAWEYLAPLVSQRKEEGAGANDWLFVFYYRDGTTKGRQLSDATVYRIYREYTGAAPHSARATFATRLLEQGAHREDVADALGHADAQAVKVYDKRLRTLNDSVAGDITYRDD